MRALLRSTVLALALTAACIDAPTAVSIEETIFDPSLGVDLAQSTKLFPSGLYYRDLTVGTGTTLAPGQTVGVRYALYFPNGQLVESNPAPAPVFPFRLGIGEVIQGWDQGIPGMKVGGRRQLIVPPELAYGSRGQGQIPGNAVLVFVVDAISAQ